MKLLAAALFLLTAPLSASLLAQGVSVHIGPSPAPLGAPVAVTLSNDSANLADIIGCSWQVFDEHFALVYDPNLVNFCGSMGMLVGPWGWNTMYWNQVDQTGRQVAAGRYWIEIQPLGQPASLHEVLVGGIDTAIWFEGTPVVHGTQSGQRRRFLLSSPRDPGAMFVQWIGHAGTPGTLGAQTCAGALPISSGPLMLPSAEGPAASAAVPLLCDALGVLDGRGVSTQPTLCPPEDTSLIGLEFSTAFVVLDPTESCPVVRVSRALELEFEG